MFGTYARNIIYGQGRYVPEENAPTRAELFDAACKSEKQAQPFYDELRKSRAFNDALWTLRKANPNKTYREVLRKYAKELKKEHPYHFRAATKMIDIETK